MKIYGKKVEIKSGSHYGMPSLYYRGTEVGMEDTIPCPCPCGLTITGGDLLAGMIRGAIGLPGLPGCMITRSELLPW